MSVIDAFVLGILAVGLALGCVRGFVSQFTGVAGLFGGLYLAASYHDAFRQVLDRHIATGHNGEIAFGLILVLSILVAAFFGWCSKKTFEKLDLGAYDRLMGGFFGAAKAGLICAGVLLALVYFAPDGGKLEASISHSKSGPMLWGAMDSVVGVLPKEYRGTVKGFLHAHSPKDEHRTAE